MHATGSGMGGDVESINQRKRMKERKEKKHENSILSQNYPLERRRNEDILDIQKGRDYAAKRPVKGVPGAKTKERSLML